MTDRVGQQLGNYRLCRLLGKGGFAEVYLGEHVYLKTPAAIKLLQTKMTNEEDLQTFLKEAQTIAQLVHPHIVRVLDFGVDGEAPYLVMDYATGGTLRQRHPRGTQLPLTTIVIYIKQVAEALQYAHEEKFIHRDVKPENILVGRREAVLLSDFGIALMAQSSRYQSTQEVIGTVAYMAPEQIQGKPRPSSDQYSLGIVIYEWITGDRPFHGSFTELCTQHLFASPPSLREKMPTISPAVEQVVMTALTKDPRQRFASIQAFATALEQASRVNQPHAPTLFQSLTVPSQSLPSLTITSPAVPLSQQTVTSSSIEGVQTLPTPPDQSGQGVSSSRLPNRPEPVRRGISRRTILLSLGVAGLAAVTSGLTWLLSSRTSHPTPEAWYDGNYLYKKSITIDHTRVSSGSDLRNFPVLISLPGNSNSDLRTAANGGYVRNSNGYDIIFTDSTETVKLDHEIENYNASTGEIEMWVRVPMLSATTDTVIYMYFGNSGISSSQENKTGVWDSNYKGVWHMADNAANTTVKESTSNNNTGTAQANTNTKTAAGEIDSALSFNGSSDYITVPNSSSLNISGFQITISAWVNTTSLTDRQVIAAQSAAGNNTWMLELNPPDCGNGKINLYLNTSNSSENHCSTMALATGTWYYVTAVYTGSNVLLYINGASQDSYPKTGAIMTNALPVILGDWISLNRKWSGMLEEVRVSNIARSNGWITTEYNNQSSPSTFYTVSSLVSR